MSDNTTATGGYLTPNNDPYGDDLTHPVHDVIAGCTGIDGRMIRPRWQQEPAPRPSIDENWCAFGIQEMEQDSWAYVGIEEMQRHERITYLLSFYGPNAMSNAALFSATAQLQPNASTSEKYGLFYGSAGNVTPAPDILNERWYNRYDVSVEYRRKVKILYNVLSILEAQIELKNDSQRTLKEIEVNDE